MVSVYGIKVVNGDLAIMGDGNAKEITGVERIRQELSHWLLEPLGADTIYERFGSSLWDSVGNPMTSEYIEEVRREVSRVVSNYVAYQARQVKEDLARSTERFLKDWGDDDIIDSVNEISVRAVADTLYVTVKLTTAGGRQIVIVQQG